MGDRVHIFAEKKLKDKWILIKHCLLPKTNSLCWVLFENKVRGLPSDVSEGIHSSDQELSMYRKPFKRRYSYMSSKELQIMATELLLESNSIRIRQCQTDISNLLTMFNGTKEPSRLTFYFII